MKGKTGPIVRNLCTRMKEAVVELGYETAAHLQDDIAAAKTVLERNTIVFDDETDAGVFALAADELSAAVYVFHVRGSRIRGIQGWVIGRVDKADEA